LFVDPDLEIGSYHFFEAFQKNYDEPSCIAWYDMYPVRGYGILADDEGYRAPCIVISSNFRPQRFVGWLSRRYSQLLTA
jgi:hypothetical protein